jgi:hypothetical protein
VRYVKLALLAGAAYLAVAYAPLVRKYFAVRVAVQELSGKQLTADNRYREIGDMLVRLERDSGVVLYRSDVRYIRDSEIPRVEVEVRIPVHFPLVGRATEHTFSLSAQSLHAGGR